MRRTLAALAFLLLAGPALGADVTINCYNSAGTSFGPCGPSFPLLTTNIGVEQPDVTGTFTNATQTTSVTSSSQDGYGTAVISISGTYGTASGVFELSDDGGTTWYPLQLNRLDGTGVETGYTSLTNTNRAWSLSTSGIDLIRVRSTAVASGTANVRISSTSVPFGAVQNPTVLGASAAANVGITPVVGGSAVSSLVLKAGAGNLYGVYAECSAACWLMVFNAVAAPSNGATTAGVASGNLVECIAIASGANGSISYGSGPPEVFSVGITAAISSTTCATLTLATTGFIHGLVQ